MNHLTISAWVVKKEPNLFRLYDAVIFDDPVFSVIVKFTLRINGSKSSRSIVAEMEARHRGQSEEAMRCELLQSVYLSYEFEHWLESDMGEPGDEWTIETIDPDGVIKWLGIDFETFKTYSKNAESLRLPSPDKALRGTHTR